MVLKSEQGLFEGTKAYRRENGRLCLFRPDQNAIRMQAGAERMCMPSPSIHQFVEAVKQTAFANKRWVIVLPYLFYIYVALEALCFYLINMSVLLVYKFFVLM